MTKRHEPSTFDFIRELMDASRIYSAEVQNISWRDHAIFKDIFTKLPPISSCLKQQRSRLLVIFVVPKMKSSLTFYYGKLPTLEL